MTATHLEVVFIAAMLVMATTGAYCAHHLNCDHPWWVRTIVMAPAIVGMFAPVTIVMGIYAPYVLDVIFAITVTALYGLVASRFSSNPWLDIRRCKKD